MLSKELSDMYGHPGVQPALTVERERVRATLREAGQLTTLGHDSQRLAAESTGTIEDARALSRVLGGKR